MSIPQKETQKQAQSISPIREVIQGAESLQSAYDRLIAKGEIAPDTGQSEVISRLETFLQQELKSQDKAKKPSWFGLFGEKQQHYGPLPDFCGVYIWGEVGRGKSMLMDLAYDFMTETKRRRVHFHAFMQEVHGRIHTLRQQKPKADLIRQVAHEMASGLELICFDELQIHDITDAAIVSRLFTEMFRCGVRVIFTSNRPPKDLYLNGLQRDQFVPFIELLEARMEVIKIRSETDYRLQQLKSLSQTYFYPLGDASEDALYDAYNTLTHCHASEPVVINVSGRRLEIEKTACGIAWLTFQELCERPLGAADYLEIASRFHTLILQGIPQLTPAYRNEAKRLVTLIDALYEHRVNLICSAQVPPDALYPSGDGSFEFERTVSRLLEMQSERYIELEHLSA